MAHRKVAPKKKNPKGAAKTRQPARARNKRLVRKRSKKPQASNLVAKVKLALGPDAERWAEEIAAVLVETARELRRQQASLRPDPRLRRELQGAHHRLTLFHDYWKAHPRIHDAVPRADPQQSRPVSAEIADLVRRLGAALERAPETKGGDGSAEMIRRWLGFAVVSAFKARGIEISKFEKGKAVGTLGVACSLMSLPRLEPRELSRYIQSGTTWFGDLKR